MEKEVEYSELDEKIVHLPYLTLSQTTHFKLFQTLQKFSEWLENAT